MSKQILLSAGFAVLSNVAAVAEESPVIVSFEVDRDLYAEYYGAWEAYSAASESNYAAPDDNKGPSLEALAQAEDALLLIDDGIFTRFSEFLQNQAHGLPVFIAFHGEDKSILDNVASAGDGLGVDVSYVSVDIDAYPTLAAAYSDQAPRVSMIYNDEIWDELYDGFSVSEISGFFHRTMSVLSEKIPNLDLDSLR